MGRDRHDKEGTVVERGKGGEGKREVHSLVWLLSFAVIISSGKNVLLLFGFNAAILDTGNDKTIQKTRLSANFHCLPN